MTLQSYSIIALKTDFHSFLSSNTPHQLGYSVIDSNRKADFYSTQLIEWHQAWIARDLWNSSLGRHRIQPPPMWTAACKLNGNCCSDSRDHWLEVAHPTTWSVMTPACLMQGFTCSRALAKRKLESSSMIFSTFERVAERPHIIVATSYLWGILLYPASWGAMWVSN